MQVTGNVQRVHQRGNATNIQVNGEWYGCGFNGVPCQEGDNVTFTYTQRGNFKNVNVAQMVINSRGTGQASQGGGGGGYQQSQAPRGGGAQSSGAVSKDDYWKRREEKDELTQKAIQFQAARNSAIAAAEILISAGVLPLGDGGRNKASPVDVALDFIDTLTGRYYNDVTALASGNTPFENPVATQEYQGDDSFNDDVPF